MTCLFEFFVQKFCCLYVIQLEALIHPFFDELRDPNVRLPNGRFVPPLFNFKSHGEWVCESNNVVLLFLMLFQVFSIQSLIHVVASLLNN